MSGDQVNRVRGLGGRFNEDCVVSASGDASSELKSAPAVPDSRETAAARLHQVDPLELARSSPFELTVRNLSTLNPEQRTAVVDAALEYVAKQAEAAKGSVALTANILNLVTYMEEAFGEEGQSHTSRFLDAALTHLSLDSFREIVGYGSLQADAGILDFIDRTIEMDRFVEILRTKLADDSAIVIAETNPSAILGVLDFIQDSPEPARSINLRSLAETMISSWRVDLEANASAEFETVEA